MIYYILCFSFMFLQVLARQAKEVIFLVWHSAKFEKENFWKKLRQPFVTQTLKILISCTCYSPVNQRGLVAHERRVSHFPKNLPSRNHVWNTRSFVLHHRLYVYTQIHLWSQFFSRTEMALIEKVHKIHTMLISLIYNFH